MMTDEEREFEIQHAMAHMSDLFDHNSPTYFEELRSAAEYYVNDINDPNSELYKLLEELDCERVESSDLPF